MTDGQFADLFSFLRVIPLAGVALLLVEWIAWLAFLPVPYRWGVPYLQRTLQGASRALPEGRTNSSDIVLVSARDGEWLFRPPYHLFKIATPFPLLGQVRQEADRLAVVGRHPFGGLLFFGAVAAQQVLVGLAPLLVPAAAERGTAIDLAAVGVGFFVLLFFYGGSLALERHRLLKAVAEIARLAGTEDQRAA